MATAGLLTPGNNCPTNDLRFSIEQVIQDAVSHRAGFKKFTGQNCSPKQQTLILDE